MKNSYKLAAPLLCAPLLAAGCALKPANFNEVVKGATDNADVVKIGLDPKRAMLVTVDAGRKVFFRTEYVGTVDNNDLLKEKVRQAVEQRRQEERDAAGGDPDGAVVKTVFFCAPSDFKYGDVVGTLDAIKEAGGHPVGIKGCDPPR